ncbi:ArnT family glycosyltransferase [Microbacterium wangchenii]|uniref:Glycosyltransferase family 39 protein n=1 Tax=Microbacterium wangchenii TaxID=2541726 RepID=A0ABX5SQV2_9MICO|nr:glycosyltransferase family 39 protein [Microbacterium wangchenii]MCK6065051.1 glycosyltransferase family 39 protein [Microbacterium sp. EYE_512]QBR88518.1 glycosyltransferase family 39 protein [Microbacterium wangchenii]
MRRGGGSGAGAVRGPQRPLVRHEFALGPVAAAMLALAVVLAVVAPLYGYHRDELYFRMLPLQPGYVDQPPLTPVIAHAVIALFGDGVVALRIVPLLCAVLSLPVLALITREVGGTRFAQALTVWGMAGATLTLMFGHVLLTASLDLLVWPAALLCAVRAVLRDDGRWWLAAGAIIGASTFNKLLVVVLMVGIAGGLAMCGPRRWFASAWLWAGVAAAAALALPSAVYQVTHGWPQLAMGAALAEDNATEVRVLMWPMLILLVGPVLAVFWVAALHGVLRRAQWRPLRFLVVTFAVIVAFVFVGGTQFYYTAGVLAVLVAVGAVPVADWVRTRGRTRWAWTLVAVNAATCAVVALPVLPLPALAASGIGDINSAVGDQVGWERYAAQIDAAVVASSAEAIITSNYGEAGAVDRFGATGVPIFSGHNALWDLGGPAEATDTVVIAGGQGRFVTHLFDACEVVDELDNGVGVGNEEQGRPITVCRGSVQGWTAMWEAFRHLD